MVSLILSVIFNTLIFIIFKVVAQRGIAVSAPVSINYATASLIGLIGILFSGGMPDDFFIEVGYKVFLLGGLLFTGFMIIGWSTSQAGGIKTNISAQTSFILPGAFAWISGAEPFSIWKLVGFLLCILAIVMMVLERNKLEGGKNKKRGRMGVIAPALVFVTSGSVGIAMMSFSSDMKYEYLTSFITFTFVGATLVGNIYLLASQNFWAFTFEGIGWGVLLGIINLLCIFFLMNSLVTFAEDSIVFAVYYTGTMTLASLLFIVIFREKVTINKIIGILSGILGILLFLFVG